MFQDVSGGFSGFRGVSWNIRGFLGYPDVPVELLGSFQGVTHGTSIRPT